MVICWLFSISMTASAQSVEKESHVWQFVEDDGGGVTVFYAYTHSTNTILSIPSSGTATAYASLQGYQGITTKVEITMTLQKKGGLFNLFWNDVTTWSQSFNSHSGTLSKQHNVSSGTYRVKAIYKAYSGNNSETNTSYSGEVKY